MNKTSIWMSVLTVTAIVMTVALVSIPQTRVAQAAMNQNSGPYTMLTAGTVGDEALILLDNSTQKMIVYRLNNNNLETLTGMTPADFNKAFARPTAPK